MGLPIWQTKSGDLGTIAEREFYRFSFDVQDTEAAETAGITFQLVAGELPAGISLKRNGSIEGVAGKRTVIVQGVPLDVGSNQTSRFAIRATTTSGRVSDRTFELTVSGQDAPTITTTQENLGSFVAGEYFEYQLEAEDLDPDDQLTWSLQSGQLPDGLTIDDQGLIRGYIEPYERLAPGVEPGYDMTRFDEYPLDFVGSVINRSFQFTVSVTDGKDYDMRTYVISIVAKDSLTADTTEVTSDDIIITADTNNNYVPVLLYPPSDLGQVLHDNYYAYKFEARDWDGDDIRFVTYTDEGSGFDQTLFDSSDFDPGVYFLPPNLRIDPVTGWLYGRLEFQVEARRQYTFGIQVVKADDTSFASRPHYVTMTVVNDLARELGWATPQDLGTIVNGDASELSVEALNPLGTTLTYRLKPGATGRLPRGLRLLDNGLIIGRVSFGSFFLDGNQTTFDGAGTTFDSTYTFTVNVRDSSGVIDEDRTFTVRVLGTNRRPYENLYLVSRTLESDRTRLERLFGNQEVFPADDVYRAQDPYFGVSRDLRMLSSYGLNPRPARDYIQAMETNHATKNLRFGDIKVARALDADGTVRYEVVYIAIKDALENASNVSVAPRITTATNLDVYPNSLANMQMVIDDEIGQINADVLPDWMTSKQEDGSITNYVRGCVLAYVVPGAGNRVAFNLERYLSDSDFDFQDIKFDVDRYVWDSNLSSNYNKDDTGNLTADTTELTCDGTTITGDADREPGRFNSSPETTFDASSTTVDQTTFDGGDTRFFSYVDLYATPDQDDKYLKFPTIGAL